jgi:hypothetical protein
MRFVTFDNIVRAAVAAVIAGLVFVVVRHPNFSNAGATIAAALLLYVTLEYVLLNHTNVKLFREQLEQQRKLYLDFGTEVINRRPFLWIANLGAATFIVKTVYIRVRGESVSLPIHILVPPGKIENFPVPEETYKPARSFVDFDISLDCLGLKHTTERIAAKAFHMLIGDGGVVDIREGILLPWLVKCPNCEEWAGALAVDGLLNFDEVHNREEGVQRELKKTCPRHSSQWLRTA